MLALIGALAPILGKVISEVIEDPDKQAELKGKVFERLMQSSDQLVAAQASIVRAEVGKGGVLSRTWRPVLMYVITAIIANNYLLLPWLRWYGVDAPELVLEEGMWSLLQIGVGGYIVGRSGEQVAKTVAGAGGVKAMLG